MAKKVANKAPKKRLVKKKTTGGVSGNLTIKQEKFCHVYMETGNASEAYRQSYNCSKMKPTTINVKACELLKCGKVAVRLHVLKEELKLTHDIKKERLLYELEAITTSRITDYIEIKDVIEIMEDPLTGAPVKVNKAILSFKDFSKLTDQQIRAIEGIKDGKYGIELKLHGKSWSIDRVNKMLGQEAPKKTDITSGGEKIENEKIIILPSNGRD